MTTQRAEVAGASLAVDDPGGDGPPFVWAHGLVSSRAIEDAVDLVGWRRLDGVRVVRYDARGHGDSGGSAEPDTYTWPALAGDLLTVMDAVGVARAAVGGASMGCSTAIYAALAEPARVERLVLVIPPTAWSTRDASRQMNLAGARLVEDGGAAAVVDLLRQQPPLPVLGEHGERWRDESVRQMLTMDPHLLAAILRGAAGSDLPPPDELVAIEAPALVLAWTGDEAHPVTTAERLADALPDATLHVGDDPADIARWPSLITEFIR